MENKERIESLEKNLNKLSEMVYEIQDNLKGSDSLSSLTNKISIQQTELVKQQESTNSAFKQLSELKSSIFAIMALFFGIFAFISIDLNFTKSIFSYSKDTKIDICLLIICFIITQFFFFIFIYFLLLKPFLNNINSSSFKNISIFKSVTITSILIFVLFIAYLLYDNYNLKKEQTKLKQEIQKLLIK